MGAIEYRQTSRRVKQHVDDISLSNGTFDEVLKQFQEKKEYWEGQVGKPVPVYARYENSANVHSSGVFAADYRKEEHCFDQFYIYDYPSPDCPGEWDKCSVPQVWGERDMTQAEIAWIKQKTAAQKEHRRQTFEQLKKEFDT